MRSVKEWQADLNLHPSSDFPTSTFFLSLLSPYRIEVSPSLCWAGEKGEMAWWSAAWIASQTTWVQSLALTAV